ncbi:MAG TPA: FecR/PupR family sigma factor regulator, partial [Phenylobacterium sp.]
MTDPRQLSTRERTEAARWHARLGNRSVTQKTLRDFEAWRERPANDMAYQDVAALWEASGRHANDPEIVGLYGSALARRARVR